MQRWGAGPSTDTSGSLVHLSLPSAHAHTRAPFRANACSVHQSTQQTAGCNLRPPPRRPEKTSQGLRV
eukprot:354644-Chlamydomonas_euryale.AAC.4